MRCVIRKYNFCVGIFVFISAAFINTLVDIAPMYFLRVIAHIIAIYMRVNYDKVAEIWTIPSWIQAVSKIFVMALLAFAVYKEMCVILRGVKRDHLLYRIMWCAILVIYAIITLVLVMLCGYSVAVVVRNWIFLTVPAVYMIMGRIIGMHTKKAKVQKKKHAKKKKKG